MEHIMAAHFKNMTEVEAIKPPEGTRALQEFWHATEKGFGVRVARKKLNGEYAKVYIARYRDEDKRDVKAILGNVADISYKDAFSLAKAKIEKARALAGDIKAGRPRAATISVCYELYLKARKAQWAPDTIIGYAKQFKNLQPLWDRRMDSLTNKEWLDQYMDVSQTRGRSTALGMMRLGSALYSFQITLENLTKNPCGALLKTTLVVKDAPRTRHVPRKELAAFWTALQTRAAGPQRDLILWVLFTGFRASLAGNLMWSRINPDEHTYRIDAKDVGNKAKMEFFHPVPVWLWDNVIVPRLAVRKPGDIYIIESTKLPGTPLHSVRGTYLAIEEITGLQLSQHDIRRTFSSIAHAATGDILLTKRLMTHGSATAKSREHGTTERYIQTDQAQYREAVELTAAKILEFAQAA